MTGSPARATTAARTRAAAAMPPVDCRPGFPDSVAGFPPPAGGVDGGAGGLAVGGAAAGGAAVVLFGSRWSRTIVSTGWHDDRVRSVPAAPVARWRLAAGHGGRRRYRHRCGADTRQSLLSLHLSLFLSVVLQSSLSLHLSLSFLFLCFSLLYPCACLCLCRRLF